MHIIVIGAGVIGVCTAWFLRERGYEVTVIDRQAGAARETSFANGGQISVSYAEPWANPRAPRKVLQWLGQADAPLLFKLRFDPRQWRWGVQFLRECTEARMRRNVAAMVALAAYSRDQLQALRAATGIEYDQLQRGIVRFYTDPHEFDAAQPAARLMRELGLDRRVIDADEVIRIEPALAGFRRHIVGGDYTADDESGDIHRFTTALAERAAERGVRFVYGFAATRLLVEQGLVAAVEGIDAQGGYRLERADAFVVANASHAPELLRSIGADPPIYPAKGYSATFRITDPAKAPTVSVTDDGRKIVFSRLGDRLRVAGTAELSGYSRALDPVRCAALTQRARELFPDACAFDEPAYWSGLRPSTPSNVPLIGRMRYANCWINAGHGTLGWTMGVGSGRVLADLIAGQTPAIVFPFLR